MDPTFELVIAHYNEDLSWVSNLPSELPVAIYSKGSEQTGFPLPNIGQEAHTYLHHIISRFNDLAEYTFFVQGFPFDHVPEFHRFLRNFLSGETPLQPFHWLGFAIDYDTPNGSRLFAEWSKNQDGRKLDMIGFWKSLWTDQPPERFPFFLGAHFAVHRDLIRAQSKSFYEKACALSTTFPDAAHCFERTWDKVFGRNGIPLDLQALALPIYLRPIRRLGLTWDDVPFNYRGHKKEADSKESAS